MTQRHLATLVGFLLALAGCAVDGVAETPPEDVDLVAEDGKTDTGYLSTLATELEGDLVAELVLDADDETRRALTDASYREDLAQEQLKFAKNQLNAEQLHLNLSGGELSEVAAREEAGKIHISYRMRIETIVTFEELRAAGITDPQSLRDRRYDFRVPSDPRTMFTRFADRCAEGFDANGLADYNYFYYFKGDKAGCDSPLTAGTFTVSALSPPGDTYPEYDQLVADRVITVAVFFGAAGHEATVPSNDWGMINWRNFTRFLTDRGFRTQGPADESTGKGKRFARTRAGLQEVVDVISPEDLHALTEDSDGLFKRLVSTHEVVLYNGHSFYGSLSVLDDPAVYAPGVYQVFLMSSCWSYEYYTKQVFRNKATADDPKGWALADVVNDTQMGWFHNMADVARILLTNLFAGAETGGRDGTRRYTWQNIIDAINRQVLDSQRRHGTDSHEIFGVSGVRTNRFNPDGSTPPPPPPASEWTRTPVVVESEHPYANNIQRSFSVEAPAGATRFRVHFDKIDTEARYDFVEVYDAAGTRVARFDGMRTDVTTPDISGRTATIKLVTDTSVTRWGFHVDAVQWRR